MHDIQPQRKGGLSGVVPDLIGAFFGAQQHAGAFQFGLVVVKGRDGKRFGGHEAVAFCGVAGRNAVDVQGDDAMSGLVAEDAENGMQWAYPAQGPCPPTHGFLPWEGADRLFQHFGDDVGCRAARLFDDRKVNLTLFVIASLKLVAGQAGRAKEARQGLFGGVGARAFTFFFQVG